MRRGFSDSAYVSSGFPSARSCGALCEPLWWVRSIYNPALTGCDVAASRHVSGLPPAPAAASPFKPGAEPFCSRAPLHPSVVSERISENYTCVKAEKKRAALT